MDDKQKTIELVYSHLDKFGDIPAISNTIRLLNKYSATEDAAVSEFANIILNDLSLTSKLLKLVNSVYYGRIGKITTVSRAVILLGLENVKNIALTLVLFDHMQKNSSSYEMADSIVKSLYCARLAHKIAEIHGLADKEEAFICALFHRFGKVLVSFSLPSRIDDIKHFSLAREVSEDLAAQSVLGASYEEIGAAIARRWNFPEKIIRSMHRLNADEIRSLPETDRLVGISNFVNQVAVALSGASERCEADEKIEELMEQFKDLFGSSAGRIKSAVDASFQDLVEYSNIFELDLKDVLFLRQLLRIYQPENLEEYAEEAAEFDETVSDSLKTFDAVIGGEAEETLETIFIKGIQDVNNSIMNRLTLNDIIRIVLETVYRGMRLLGQCRAVFFVKNAQLSSLDVRYGLGNDIEGLRNWFRIPLDGEEDIFNMAITKQSDLIVKNLDAPDIKRLIPKWFRDNASPDIFIIILPITINRRAIGMFYIEGQKSDLQNISGNHLTYLKILRDQAVVAISQIQGF